MSSSPMIKKQTPGTSSPPTSPTPTFGNLTLEPNGNPMQCVICKQGQTHPGVVTVTLERDNSIVILKAVPAEVCENCGEYYLSESVTEAVLDRAELAVNHGTEVEIVRYAA